MHARTHARTDACVPCGTATHLFREERKRFSSNAYKQFYNTYIFKNFTTYYLHHTNTNDCTPPPPPPRPTLCPLRNDVHARTNKKSPPLPLTRYCASRRSSHIPPFFEAFCLGFITVVEKGGGFCPTLLTLFLFRPAPKVLCTPFGGGGGGESSFRVVREASCRIVRWTSPRLAQKMWNSAAARLQ